MEKHRDRFPNREKIGRAPLSFGFSISNKGNPQNPDLPLPQSMQALFALASSRNAGVEIQLEFDDGVTQIPDISLYKLDVPFLGVHLPIIGVDMTRDDPEKQRADYVLFDTVIKMAADLQADYLVCHLHGNLNWNNLNQRDVLIDKMKSNAMLIARSMAENNFKGKLLFENLEFPLYPATNAEIANLMVWVKDFEERYNIKTGFCLDLSHLWHSGLLMSENGWRPEVQQLADPFNRSAISFPVYLASLLEQIGDRLEAVHITGTGITSNKHDTHLLPTVTNAGDDSDRGTMDIASSLQSLYNYALQRDKSVPVINEAHGYSYQDMLNANQSMVSFLKFCFPEREITQEQIDNPWAYYNNPHVVRSILAFLGTEGDSWQQAANIQHAYMGIAYEAKLWRGKKSPVSTVDPQYISRMIDNHNGYVELHASLLSSAENGRPSRAILIWDLDRYRLHPDNQGGHNYDQSTPILTPQDTFQALEPVINLYLRAFDLLQIPVMATLSGKGVHFIAQVTDPVTIDYLAAIGGPVEESLSGKLADAPRITKAKRAIPEIFQRVHVGAGRLQQMLNMYLIRESRNLLAPYFGAEIFNKGYPGQEVNGIAFDNAAIMFPVYLKPFSALGSLYFIKGIKSGLHFPDYSIQIPINGNGYRYRWTDVFHNRSSFSAAAAYLGSVDCHIPNAGNLDRLLQLYAMSDIRNLHEAMNAGSGDDPWSYNNTYRKDNYRLVNSTSEPDTNRRTIDYASAFLGGSGLQYYYFDKLIFQLYQAMGGGLDAAPHVAGFIRALYEDPSKGWGNTWTGKMDAATYARKITEQFLGQMFESDTGDFWRKMQQIM